MLSTLRLQARAATFSQSVLSALRQAAQCLPLTSLGLQLQRVRLNGASLRNNKVAVWRKWRGLGPHDQGLGWADVRGKQVQFALAVTIDVAQTSTIAANSNEVMAAEFSANATVVFDVDREESTPAGSVEIIYRIADVEPAVTLPVCRPWRTVGLRKAQSSAVRVTTQDHRGDPFGPDATDSMFVVQH